MAEVGGSGRPPRRAVVIGAGIVGLSVAWHLQRRGIEVVVVEREDVAAGSSWGNAGWISPGLVAPLPDPAVRRYALRAFTDPSSAIYVPPSLDPLSWAFLANFALRCTRGAWRRTVPALVALSRQALDAHDELRDAGVPVGTVDAPVVAAFAGTADAAEVRHELEGLARAGQPVTWRELGVDEARALAPHLSPAVGSALRIDGQRFVDPGAYVTSLADAVRALGAQIRTGVEVRTLGRAGGDVLVHVGGRESLRADAVVVATGAWIGRLLPPGATGVAVRAGRGYSFTVDVEPLPSCPVYLPHARVACTPYRGALRVGGGMEVAAPDRPLDLRRILAIEAGARPYLQGVDWSSRRDDWVGSRPITADGLPLVGATRERGIFVAGGHGMWGMTLGPLTGRLLAALVAEGAAPPALVPLDPRRRPYPHPHPARPRGGRPSSADAK